MLLFPEFILCDWRRGTANADMFTARRSRRLYRIGHELRKDYIIFNIVMMTNVFSCGGVNSWNVFSLRSLCGSRLMNYHSTFLLRRFRTSNRNRLDYKGLCGSSPISLLGLALLGGWSIISGVLGLALSGFGFTFPCLLKL